MNGTVLGAGNVSDIARGMGTLAVAAKTMVAVLMAGSAIPALSGTRSLTTSCGREKGRLDLSG